MWIGNLFGKLGVEGRRANDTIALLQTQNKGSRYLATEIAFS